MTIIHSESAEQTQQKTKENMVHIKQYSQHLESNNAELHIKKYGSSKYKPVQIPVGMHFTRAMVMCWKCYF